VGLENVWEGIRVCSLSGDETKAMENQSSESIKRHSMKEGSLVSKTSEKALQVLLEVDV
jgi:hypothetical protein